MHLDPTAYIRLSAPNSLGASASGAAFATSTGDVLEVACYGAGVFRLRIGASTKPDYGLDVGRAQRCEVAQPQPGVWSFSSGGTRFQPTGEPPPLPLLHHQPPPLTSITPEPFPR